MHQMIEVYTDDNIDISGGAAVALGCFDALHIAHTALIRSCVNYAHENGYRAGVVMFDERPECVLRGKLYDDSILTNEAKYPILESVGVDFVYIKRFRSIVGEDARHFIELMLSALDIKAMFAGFHYHFGKAASGDAEMLRQLGTEMGFDVEIMEPVMIGDTIVSSTHVRKLIKLGDVENAAIFLGREFSLCGSVYKDRGVGRSIGIPTANLVLTDGIILPAFGVYATMVAVDGERYAGVTNVGVRPTFGLDKPTVETYILDFDGDIYGKEISVSFCRRIRNEITFANKSELMAQIEKDIFEASNALK